MVVVGVPDSVGDKLTVTITQGKKTTKQTWSVRIGEAYGIKVAHFPILVTPNKCVPMTITARVGKVKETRTIIFDCTE